MHVLVRILPFRHRRVHGSRTSGTAQARGTEAHACTSALECSMHAADVAAHAAASQHVLKDAQIVMSPHKSQRKVVAIGPTISAQLCVYRHGAKWEDV